MTRFGAGDADGAGSVEVERVGAVAVVRVDRPRANALSSALLDALVTALESLAADLPGAVVLWGGERVFSAGADVRELADPALAPGLLDAFRRACDALAGLPRTTIAAVAGYALGGGLELALACDLRVASEAARAGQPEILLGIVPGAGGTQRLARLVGPARAKDLVLTGRQVDMAEASRIGLVDRVVAPEDVLDGALLLATELASGAVVAQGLAKAAIDAWLGVALDAGLSIERTAIDAALATADAKAGIASFLREGPGKAVFVGG